jgi:hypothetical protein
MEYSLKFAMTMTAFKRPKYLQTALDSLSKNGGLDDYVLNFGIEPGNEEVIKICKSVSFMQSNAVVNPRQLGVRDNPYELLKRTFNSGVDGVLYLEDDIVISTDAVGLATWYLNHPRRNEFLCMNLYNHDSRSDADPAATFAGSKFSALGFAITKEQWATHFEPAWKRDARGWDFSITGLIASGLRVLQPRISRSHHIGREGGTHYRAHRDDAMYVANPMWNGPPQEFKIEE